MSHWAGSAARNPQLEPRATALHLMPTLRARRGVSQRSQKNVRQKGAAGRLTPEPLPGEGGCSWSPMVDARRSARTAAAQRAHAAGELQSEPSPRISVQGSLLPNAASSSTVVSVWQHRTACLLRCAAQRRGNRLVRLAVQRGPPAARSAGATTGAAAGIACAAGASSRQQAGDCAGCSARSRTSSSCGPSASILSRPRRPARAHRPPAQRPPHAACSQWQGKGAR